MNEWGRAFYDQLRALEERAEANCRTAGRPYSRRETEHALRAAPYEVELSGQRISDWLPDDPGTAKIPSPASGEKVWALVQLWSLWAGEEPQESQWRTLLDRAQPARLHRTTDPGPGRPVGTFTDPFALEVHRAIETEPADEGTSREGVLPPLPAYIDRAHDKRLRAIVRQAVVGRSRIAVLVGGSSTGKTRACWEALELLPRDWRLWHPIDPSRPDAALGDMERIGPRTVVWLNEAQHYLLTPAADVGERVAAGLRALLTDPSRGPVLVLGTIWPEYWAQLTTPPHADGQDRSDPHAQARQLLGGHELPVPVAFTDPGDVQGLRAAAAADPRLAHAADRAEEGQVTQYLAGGPALLERYHTAPAAARALVDAAIDARRLGLGPALPSALLEEAADGYLTATQWDLLPDDWFEEAMAHVARGVRGARGALTRVRPRPGEPAPLQTHYRLADYLEQHGRRARASLGPPASLWTAATRHALTADRAELSELAQQRGLCRISFGLYRDLAAEGHTEALDEIISFLSVMGRMDEALAWYRYAADVGHTVDIGRIAWVLGNSLGCGEEALVWYRLLVSKGDLSVVNDLVRLLARMGHTQEALVRAADPAVTVAALELAETAMMAGRDEDAVIWFRLAAERGDTTALRGAAVVLVRLGRAEEALALLLRYAEQGDVFAMGEAGWLLGELGRDEAALTWYLRAVEAGDGFAHRCVARLLARTDREAEARAWYRRAALEKGDPYALEEEKGKQERIPGILGPALIGYDWNAAIPWLLARVRGTHQRSQEPSLAIDNPGLDFLVTLNELAQEAQRGGTFGALHEADDILGALREHELLDEAVAWCWTRATEGAPYNAWWTAHRLLQGQGRADQSQRLRRNGWEPDGRVAEPWEALPPEEPLPLAALVRDSGPSPHVEEGDQDWWRMF